LAEPIRVAWHTTKPSGGLAEQSTITTLAGGEATPEQIERARLVVVCMGDGAPPESRKAEKLVAQVTGALPRLTGLANKVIRSDAGATSYQSLVLGLVEGALKQTGSLPEHWIITKAADHPGALRAPHDWTGVRRTVDGGKDEQAPPFPHAEQPRGFVNVSNHPSDSWSPEQTQAALELGLGEVWDWPGGFPAVAPVAAGDEVSGFARELSSRIVGERPAGAFVSGEFALTAALVQRLREAGVRCFCATTERDVRDELVEGALRKVSRFRFVRWREFV
jgi:hypothetical protein